MCKGGDRGKQVKTYLGVKATIWLVREVKEANIVTVANRNQDNKGSQISERQKHEKP